MITKKLVIKKLFLFCAIISLTVPLYPVARIKNPLTPHKTLHERCGRLSSVAQEIAQRLSCNTLRTKHKAEYLKWLTSINKSIAQMHATLEEKKAISTDLSNVSTEYQELFAQHTVFTASLLAAIKNNFTETPVSLGAATFKEKTQKLIIDMSGTADALQKIDAMNGELLHTLEIQMETAGLSKFNQAYRALSENTALRKVGLAASALVGIYGVYRLHKFIHAETPTPRPQKHIRLRSPFKARNPKPQKPRKPRVHIMPRTLPTQIPAMPRPTRKEIINQIVSDMCVAASTLGMVHAIHRAYPTKPADTLLLGSALYTAGNNVLHVASEWGIPDYLKSKATTIHEKLRGNAFYYKPTAEQQEKENPLTLDDPLFAHLPQAQALRDIALSLTKAEEFSNAGIKRPKAHLLVGPSGCGKSFAIKGLIGTINELNKKGPRVQLVQLKSKDFEHPHIIKHIKDIIKEKSPCIIFIDEFHLFGYGMQAESNKVLLRHFLMFLDELDLDTNCQARIIGATNREDLLDKALLRHGRFNKIIFQHPNFNQRVNILTTLCSQAALSVDPKTIAAIAHPMQGCVNSDLNKLFEEAAAQAKQNKKSIDEYLYVSLNSVIRKLQPTPHLAPEELERIAAHQSGQALIHLILHPRSMILDSVTTQAYPQVVQEQYDRDTKMTQGDITKKYIPHYGALFSYAPYQELNCIDNTEIMKQCKILLAGTEAQKILLTSATNYGQSDYAKAYQLLIDKQCNGITLDLMADDDQQVIKKTALQQLKQYQQEVHALLVSRKKELAALSQALQAKTFLTRQEIDDVIRKTASQS